MSDNFAYGNEPHWQNENGAGDSDQANIEETESELDQLVSSTRDALRDVTDSLGALYAALDVGLRRYARDPKNNISPDARGSVEEATVKAKTLRNHVNELLHDLKNTLPPVEELFSENR